MEIAISAARWVVGRALSPVTDGVLEAWAASSTLGPNFRKLKLELLHAQSMLDNASGRGVRNPALQQLLLELRHLAYVADDVLDELDYFRIQDDLDGTHETVDDADEERGLVRGLLLHTRHTTRAVATKLTCSCSAAGSRVDDPAVNEQEDDAEHGRCLAVASDAIGKRPLCFSLPSVRDDAGADMPANKRCFLCCARSSKAQQTKQADDAPKLKFDRVEMSKKINDILEQLRPLCDKVNKIIGPERLVYPNNAQTQAIHLERRPKTTSQIIEPELYGRQNQKKTLVDEIINGKYCDNDLTVLPIVGLGGIGKTTLTQHIYQELKSHFQVSVWACVSQNFNANKLAQEIVKQMPEVSNENKNDSDQERIEKRIQSKRFLLVLDDIWTYHEDEWKQLLAPFRKGGTKGNMVLVTTRIPKVAKMVESSHDSSIQLERLQDGDSIQLLETYVFGDKKSWKDYPPRLQDVGKEIVKKLKGFPPAVKIVGRLLKNRLSLEQWERILESKEWELKANDDDTMQALKLSYNYLPFHLQQCFSYCALFPEDYRFGREELINLWIGLELLGTGNQNKTIEDIGLGYFDELVDNGFFKQDGEEYVVHDLLHELATNVSSYEALRINSGDVRSIQIPSSTRHVSIIIDDKFIKDRMTFENHKKNLSILGKKLKAGNLRTIMLFGDHHGSFFKILGDMLREAKSIRVVYLSGASYKFEDLLHNFLRLVHLRYLRIIDSSISKASLPINISRFYHLLVLDLQKHTGQLCFLRYMKNLKNLRHFLVPDVSTYCSIFEVGKLKYLKELQRFDVKREMQGFELKQIGQLLELQGPLAIYNLENVDTINEADEANLAHLSRLDRLELVWGNDNHNRNLIEEGNILDTLKPHRNLRELHIAGNGGATCPNWLGVDLSIKNLEALCLTDVNWDVLPLPGKLCMTEGKEHQGCVIDQCFHNLKSLKLVKISRLKKWCENNTHNLLPFLQDLTIRNCYELIELPLVHSTSCFPKLQTISIEDCPKLMTSFPPIPWTCSLSSVKISGVSLGFEELDYQHSETTLRIEGKNTSDGEFWNLLDFSNLTELRKLTIKNCPTISLDHLKMLICLETIYIDDSSNVLLPIDVESNAQYKLPVEELYIERCAASGKELTHLLFHFPKLSRLDIKSCPNVAGLIVAEQQTMTTPESSSNKAVVRGQQQTAAGQGLLLLPPQIQELRFWGCDVLNFIDGGKLHDLLSLRVLEIGDCPKLLCSGSSFPTSLQELSLVNVKDLETLQGPLPNLTQLSIQNCGHLTNLLAQGHLTNLQELSTDDFEGVLTAPICCLLSSSLTDLTLEWNHEVEYFTKEQEKALQILTSIQNLKISNYKKLRSLPTAGIRKLKKLEIYGCPAISSLGRLPDSLQQLVIFGGLAISSLDSLPDSLQHLSISICPAISSLAILPKSLQHLEISYCPAIHCLPKDALPLSLRKIDVRRSDNEKLKRQCHELKGSIPVISLD